MQRDKREGLISSFCGVDLIKRLLLGHAHLLNEQRVARIVL